MQKTPMEEHGLVNKGAAMQKDNGRFVGAAVGFENGHFESVACRKSRFVKEIPELAGNSDGFTIVGFALPEFIVNIIDGGVSKTAEHHFQVSFGEYAAGICRVVGHKQMGDFSLHIVLEAA